MTNGALRHWDRLVIVVCAFVSVASVVGVAMLWRVAPDTLLSTHFELFRWISRAGAVVPPCAALAAVVLTGRAFVGVAIAAGSAVLATVFGAAALSGGGATLGALDYVTWTGWSLVVAAALLAADLMALRLGRFTPGSGAVAGLLVAVATIVIQLVPLIVGSGLAVLTYFAADFWVGEYALPLVALVLTGLVAGVVAERVAGPQVVSGPRVPVD